MLYFSAKKHNCTGCGACIAVCPVECISFVSEEEGFFYPIADSRCINCGKCEKVCPVTNERSFSSGHFKQFCVAALHKDIDVWRKSSSGGAFSAICKAFCNDGDAIFGAKFEGLRVVHDYVYGPDNIESFRKSKYVQSDIRDSYNRVKNILESNKKVLFSGTPCQVAGLRSFLGKEYENLLCVDLVCHGVGSPGVFKKYIEYLEKKYASRVVSYTFRNKKAEIGRFLQHIIIVDLEDGRRIEDSSDLYNTGFIQTLFLRPSCGECKFANLKRVGDVTIADFKKKYELLPEVKGYENLSTIIVNSEKGAEVFEKLKEILKIYPANLDDVARENPPLRLPSKMNKNRDGFFHDLRNGIPIEQVLTKYIAVPGLPKRIWLHIPDKIRARIKRWVRWVKK